MTMGGSSKGCFSSRGGYPWVASTSAIVELVSRARRARSAAKREEGASEAVVMKNCWYGRCNHGGEARC